MASDDTSNLNVSLEPHLIDTLEPLLTVLPNPLADELNGYISDTPKGIIPYSTLLAISQWSRTPEGKEKLHTHTPPLNPSSFMMVSLLAGVKTSPERNFGTYKPPPQPEQLAEQQKRERKEITAILNALLSIFGVGFSAWWAADKLHWKEQWRVLLALAASLIVAIAEGGLFIIWHSRQSASASRRKPSQRVSEARHKKFDDDANEADETDSNTEPRETPKEAPTLGTNNLRQRRL